MRQDDQMKMTQKLDDGTLLFRVDKTFYDRESILASAYKFTDTCYIHVESIDSEHYGVYFSPRQPDVDLASQVNSFCNELIDQQVRHSLEKSNKSIKEMIVKKAFFPFQGNEGQ